MNAAWQENVHLLFLGLLFLAQGAAGAETIRFIDTHVHLEHSGSVAMARTAALMERFRSGWRDRITSATCGGMSGRKGFTHCAVS